MKSASVKLKTPLRYPGGKSRATVKMAKSFPNLSEMEHYHEPFLGGGSVALYVAQMYPHLSVWVNDLYAPLVTFWLVLRDQGEDLQRELLSLKTKHSTPEAARELFTSSKDIINNSSHPFNVAAAFYVVNKCSFSGLTESSSFSQQASNSNFSVRGIEKLTEYSTIIKNWKITNYDYKRLLSNNPTTFVYLDPPYDIKDNLYGRKGQMHKSFDHDDFAETCSQYLSPMMISYNSSNPVLQRFVDWDVVEYNHTYTMRSVGNYMTAQQDRKELLLFNYA